MFLKTMKRFFSDKKNQYTEKASDQDIKMKNQSVNTNLDKTVTLFKSIYSFPDNMDVYFRTLTIGGINKKATLLFIKTISDLKLIDEQVISPLLLNTHASKPISDIISINSVETCQNIKEIIKNVNKGCSALFIDGENQAYLIGATKFEGRNIDESKNEVVVKGPKEAFNELAMTNISLIRKKIRSENLVVESATISKRSHNELYTLYVKDLVNGKLLEQVKEKINALDVDAISNLPLLEQYIEDRKLSVFPTVLYTERPDRAASFLEDGYIVLLMDNSPASLVLPATFWSFYHTSEDHYLRLPYGNFIRALRMFAFLITLLASSIYVAITSFHTEMLPTDLLLAIAATREKVPFPAFVEILLMETSFELIREAGLRVPSPIGPTIGIVGALILGQAAVEANIVSPIVVIVVALGGLSSFVVGDISMNFAIRMCRLALIIASSLFGFFGLTALFICGVFYMMSIKSFGVPYFAPMTPKYLSSNDTIFRRGLDKGVFRPGYLKPKDIEKKPKDTGKKKGDK